jgi:hypothetical protein
MVAHISESHLLVERVARRVQELTCGRIRDLAVEEVHGTVVVRGSVPSHHVRQLALQGALELLSAESCRPLITVG